MTGFFFSYQIHLFTVVLYSVFFFRYNREINEYHKKLEDLKMEVQQQEATTEAVVESPVSISTASTATHNDVKPPVLADRTPLVNGGKETIREIRTGDYDIPIFTDEFLDHNKMIDSELRTLRKSNTDYEQQNAVLEKHVENMRNGIDKLESEQISLKDNNKILQNYIDKLKEKLTNSFAGLPVPGHDDGASIDNIEEYMTELHNIADNHPQNPGTLNKAKDIIRKLDLQIHV